MVKVKNFLGNRYNNYIIPLFRKDDYFYCNDVGLIKFKGYRLRCSFEFLEDETLSINLSNIDFLVINTSTSLDYHFPILSRNNTDMLPISSSLIARGKLVGNLGIKELATLHLKQKLQYHDAIVLSVKHECLDIVSDLFYKMDGRMYMSLYFNIDSNNSVTDLYSRVILNTKKYSDRIQNDFNLLFKDIIISMLDLNVVPNYITYDYEPLKLELEGANINDLYINEAIKVYNQDIRLR